MSVLVKNFKVKKKEFVTKHFEILNSILAVKLSSKEIEVLAEALSLDKNIIKDVLFNPVSRKLLMDKLGLSPGGLGNHLSSMVKKGYLTKNEITGNIELNGKCAPNFLDQRYMLKLTLEDVQD